MAYRKTPIRQAHEQRELRLALAALAKAAGDKSAAAKALGISRVQLYRILARARAPTGDPVPDLS